MADNIKQIKVEGVSYDLNAKYIQDGSGNPKTWQNIADMINAGVKLVIDNARKEAAGDGGIGAAGAIDTTVSITDTAGAPTVTGSGGGATVTSAAAGGATVTSTSAGAHTHSVTIAAHSHTVNVDTATLAPITAVGAATGSAGGHTHSITPTTATLSYVTGATLSAAGGATVNSSSAGGHTHSITPSTGTAAAPASYADGVLSLGSMSVVTGVSATGSAGAHTHSVTIAAHSHTVNVATDRKSVV